MAKAGFEAMRKFRPDKRPWLLTRSGWAGIQRYSWHWTGDTETSWTSLRQTVAAVLGLGFSGVPFTGPDIGGFSGAPDAELFIRWHQLAAFLPFFRNHSAMGTPRREPWRFGLSILDIAREFLRLRRKLRPYLYTLAWEASQTGHPLVRPLFWHEEMDQRLWALDDTFTLGNAFLVAPVLESDAETRSLTLPEGLWYDFWEKNEYKGPDEIELEVALDRIPVLVRAGSILPLASGSSLELHIFAQEEGISDGILYSDAGDGYGDWRLDRFRTTRLAEELRLDWEQEGEFLFPYEGIVVHLHGFTAQEARIDDDQVQVPLQDNKLEIGFFQRVRFIGNFE
jgi:alpha-glucosidase